MQTPCPLCDGKGYIVHEGVLHMCTFCDGTGQELEVPPTPDEPNEAERDVELEQALLWILIH